MSFIRASAVLAFWAIALWAVGCKQEQDPQPRVEGPSATTGVSDVGTVSVARSALRTQPGLNVLFVSVDTTRPDYLACYGHPKSKTPHIDRLAAEGTRFATCVSSMPLTLGSHCTMLTGSYPYVHGARENGIFKLCEENRTLAEVLRDHGYATTAEVATIILDAKYGMNQGFDYYGDVPEPPPSNAAAMVFGGMERKSRSTTQPTPMVTEQLPGVERDASDVSDKVIAALEQHSRSTKPFLVFAHFYDPHWPFTAPEPFKSQFPGDPYLAEIAYFDANLGRILDALTRLGLDEKTLVVLTSDHGESKGQHGEFTHGSFLYDATLHVPLIMRCKGLIPPGQVVQSQVRLVDLAQTILDLAGLGAAQTSQMQGTSLGPVLADPRVDLNLVCYSDTIVPKTTYGFSPLRSLRTQDWKYILSPVPELYDLRSDRLELFNIAGAESDRAMAKRQTLWDLIQESPPSPCERVTIEAVDKKSLTALRALGYIGSAEALDDYTVGTELDRFEPKGANPREHVEEIELFCGALGTLRFGYLEEAELLLTRLHKLMPDHSMVTSALGTALVGLKKYEEAEKMIRRSVELTPEDSDEWAQLGAAQALLEKYRESETSLRKALELNPKNAVAWTNLGVALTHQGRHEESLKALEQADRIAPGVAVIWTLRGEAEQALNQFDLALASYRKAMDIDPTVVRAQRGLAAVLMRSGKWNDAIAHLTKAVELLPEAPVLQLQLGQCYVREGRLEESNKALRRALEIDPELAAAHFHLGTNLRALQRESDAVDVLRKAVQFSPALASAQAQLAGALHKSGQPKEALAEYEKLLSRRPDYVPGYRAAARIALELKQPAKAIEILERGAKLFKEEANIVNDLAWLLATSSDSRLRDGLRAVVLAERISMLTDHHDPNRLDTLAAAYAEVGDFEKARSTVDRAIEVADPSGDKALIEELKTRRELYQHKQPFRSH